MQKTDTEENVGRIAHYLGRVYYNYVTLMQRLLSENNLQDDLRPGMGHILFELWAEDNLIIKDLVDRLQLSPSALTGMLRRMEHKSLVVCRSDKDDKRAVRVSLTSKGRSLERECRQLRRRIHTIFTAHLAPEQIDCLEASLEQVILNLREALDS